MQVTASKNLMEAHNQWANRPADQRFETLASLRDKVNARRLRSRSVDVDIDKLKVAGSDGSPLLINGTIQPATPSHWSFGQLASWVKAPGNYLRTLPPALVADNLNFGISRMQREALKFMTITPTEDDGINTLQAVTSPTYGRIWDADVCDAVARIQERTGGRFFNPKAYVPGSNAVKPSGLYASDHDVFIFMIDGGSLLDAGDRAQLHRGFITWNSETGAKTFGLMTFLFNAVCGNHIIWGASQVNKLLIRHSSGGPARFDADAAPMLAQYAEGSAAPELAAVKRAQAYMLPAPGKDDADLIAWIRGHGKFSKPEAVEAIAAARKEEGDCKTLWQVIQGGTAYARSFDFVDARVEVETRFSNLLEMVKS